jgi:hypothetical protein
MSGIYTSKEPELGDLSDVQTENVSNNDHIRYDATSTNWKNQSDFITDEIDCRVLRVSETADIVGRLANEGVASFVNEEFIFQNGISTLGDVLYIDNVNNRVGINKAVPEEDLDIDGNIQINTNGTEKITFYDNGHDHEHGKLLFTTDGTDGAEFEVHTLTDGGSVSQKLTINNAGAIGLGATPNYGTSGSVLTSNGSSALPSWTTPYYFRVYKNTDQTLTDNTTSKIIGFIHDTNASTSQGITDFDTTNNLWSPSIAGVYFVVAQLQIVGGTDPTTADLLRARVRLLDNATSTTLRSANYWSDHSDDGIYQMSVSFNDLLYTDGSTSYYLDAFVNRIGTATSKISGQVYHTWWSAYKVG